MITEDKDDIAEFEISKSEELPEQEKTESPTDSLRILEAILFASDEIVTSSKLKAILPDNPDSRQIRKMIEKINIQLQKERHPFEIVEIGGGYQFRTVSYYHPWVRQIFKEKAAKKLSIQSLECLAIIAYKQPLSKAEIEAIRGVVSDGAMKTLLEKRLVTITGRSDKPGRPLQYGTTNEFLKYFGLNKIEDLPRLEEFEAIAREKIDELSIDELQKEQKTTPDEELAVNETETETETETVNSDETFSSDQTDAPSSQTIPSQEHKKNIAAISPNSPDYDTQKNSFEKEQYSESYVFTDTVDIDYVGGSEIKTIVSSLSHESENADKQDIETIEHTENDLDSAEATAVFEVKTVPTVNENVVCTEGFEFNDGITEDEMTETALQARENNNSDSQSKSIPANIVNKAAVNNADKTSGSDIDEEKVLEVIIPPPEEEK